MIQDATETLVNGQSLTADQAAAAMDEIMSGQATPAQFGAFVTALRMKGETVGEVAGMARVMREKSVHVEFEGPLLDTCGTGGDGAGTFNISTTVGLVAAGAGVTVAKHGNRAMSGACGSADVLDALGVNIDLSPEGVSRCLEDAGFGFMFAQRYHPSMRFAAGPRREIGIRTVFNILGPLTNPAGAAHQVIGVADPNVGEKMALVLSNLGSTHAIIVHGSDGLDEVTPGGETRFWEMKDGEVTTGTITPEQLGFERASPDTLRISSPEESAGMVRAVLNGAPGPARDVVLMNAAVALLAADRVASLQDGVAMAAKSIDSGAANQSLEKLAAISQELK
jgi:anthranilate phosphoribosyltransferase